jgi:hypothetical protein
MIAALCLVGVFLAVLSRPIYESIRDMKIRWTEHDAAERIGKQQALGLRERITGNEIAARAAERK